MGQSTNATAQSLSEAIAALIEAAHAADDGVIIRLNSGKAFYPRGTVTVGGDYLQFTAEDPDGKLGESIIPFRTVCEIVRDIR